MGLLFFEVSREIRYFKIYSIYSTLLSLHTLGLYDTSTHNAITSSIADYY